TLLAGVVNNLELPQQNLAAEERVEVGLASPPGKEGGTEEPRHLIKFETFLRLRVPRDSAELDDRYRALLHHGFRKTPFVNRHRNDAVRKPRQESSVEITRDRSLDP